MVVTAALLLPAGTAGFAWAQAAAPSPESQRWSSFTASQASSDTTSRMERAFSRAARTAWAMEAASSSQVR